MEHRDVTPCSPLQLANDAGDSLTLANSTPFQTATSASSTVPRKDSEAKKVLLHHIASGFVTDGMAAKEAYNDKRPSKGSTPNNCCRRKQWYLMVCVADLKSLGSTWICGYQSANDGETALVLMEVSS